MILRYPEGKEEITGIKYEPWHFRYVGLPHAYYCWENDLCWEEYVKGLTESGYSLTLDSRVYWIYYTEAKNGAVSLPDSLCWDYTVSGDNRGGYVVTACRIGA